VLKGTALTFDGCEEFIETSSAERLPSIVGDDVLYQPLQPRSLPIPAEGTVEVSLIPYYAWANRGLSMMDVWLPLAERDSPIEHKRLIAGHHERKTPREKNEDDGFITVNDDDPAIEYGPGMQSKKTWGLVNNDEHFTMTKGSFFEFTFTGTDIIWLGSKGPWRGFADVYIDGKKVVEVNPYAPKQQLNVELFREEGLPHAEHTIKIVCQARKGHPNGKEPYINLDAFQWRGTFF